MKLADKLLNVHESDKNTETIKIKVTDSNNAKIQQLFKKAKNNVLDGEVEDATYQAYLSGVKKDELGTFNVEIKSFVDSNTMRKKFKKEVLSKLGMSEAIDEAKKISDFDRTIIDGNKLELNKALQSLDAALVNYRGLEDEKLFKLVNTKIGKAWDLIAEVNKKTMK